MFDPAVPSQTVTGALEQTFWITRPNGTVPGVLWRPSPPIGLPPLVLIGHGGSGDKRSARVVQVATWLCRHGIAAAAIDGPFHGERCTPRLGVAEYQARIIAEGAEAVLDRMTGDWRAVVDAMVGVVDTTALAYVGMSMGARYGLALAAELGDELRCAVLGKFGVATSALLPAGLHPRARIEADAGRVRRPLLLHVQWDDEVFPRGGQLALFDLLNSAEKQLLGYPGRHGDTPPSAVEWWGRFIATRLLGSGLCASSSTTRPSGPQGAGARG